MAITSTMLAVGIAAAIREPVYHLACWCLGMVVKGVRKLPQNRLTRFLLKEW